MMSFEDRTKHITALLEFKKLTRIRKTAADPWETYRAGDRIRANMASRFGDIGLTTELNKAYGYEYRVPIIKDPVSKHVNEQFNFDEDVEVVEVYDL
jgi:hypothetical protein